MLGRSFTPKYGVKITATTHEVSRAMQTTQKRFLQYSPALDAAKPTGISPMIVTSVPASMGAAVWQPRSTSAISDSFLRVARYPLRKSSQDWDSNSVIE